MRAPSLTGFDGPHLREPLSVPAPTPPEDRVEVRTLQPVEWTTLRDLRLQALRDAPVAFESTAEDEALLGEADWRQRIDRRAVAFLSERPVGLVGWSPPDDTGTTELVSMWVHPDVRGTTTAQRLVTFVTGIARSRGDTLDLAVRVDNAPARRFYERCGFTPIGTEAGRRSGELLVWMRLADRRQPYGLPDCPSELRSPRQDLRQREHHSHPQLGLDASPRKP